MSRTVVVLGGGVGGVIAARTLRRHLEPGDRVVLVDRTAEYRFQPSFPWVMNGTRRPHQITGDRLRLRRRGVEVLEAEALAIDADARVVETSAGRTSYDRLVIALGAEVAPELLPGFAESALNVYTLEGATAANAALESFGGGRVVVLVSRLPFKCPAAPYETALLAEAYLRGRGIRGKSSVDVYTPEPYPMPTAGPELGAAVQAIVEARGIGVHTLQTVERVEPGELVLSAGERVPFTLLLGVPPHRAPAVVRASPMANETGFVPVDRGTLETTAEGVYAIGDVTSISIAQGKVLPKAGVFAQRQAKIVASRLAAELRGSVTSARFDGSGACFLELGDGVAAFARGNFFSEPAPEMRLHRPGRHWHLARAALEVQWLRWWLR